MKAVIVFHPLQVGGESSMKLRQGMNHSLAVSAATRQSWILDKPLRYAGENRTDELLHRHFNRLGNLKLPIIADHQWKRGKESRQRKKKDQCAVMTSILNFYPQKRFLERGWILYSYVGSSTYKQSDVLGYCTNRAVSCCRKEDCLSV